MYAVAKFPTALPTHNQVSKEKAFETPKSIRIFRLGILTAASDDWEICGKVPSGL